MNGAATVVVALAAVAIPPAAEVVVAAVVVVVVVVIRPSGYLVSSVTVWVPFGLFTTVFVMVGMVGAGATGSAVTTAGAEVEATAAAGAYSGLIAGGNSVVALLSTSTTSALNGSPLTTPPMGTRTFKVRPWRLH